MDRDSSGRGQRRGQGGGRRGRARGRTNTTQERGAHQDSRGDRREQRVEKDSQVSKISGGLAKVQVREQSTPPSGVKFVPPPTLPQPGATAYPHSKPGSEVTLRSAPVVAAGNIPPNRPGYGSIGVEVAVIVNFFNIHIPAITIHQFDVKMFDVLSDGSDGERSISEKYVCKMIMESLSRGRLQHNYPAYNGRSILYCRDNIEGRYEVVWKDPDDGDRERKHLVVLKHAAHVDLSLLTALTRRTQQFPSRDDRDKFLSQHQAATNAVDAIFRQFAASRFTPVGRSFYRDTRREENFDLESGLQLWEGFSQSARPGHNQVYMNIDMSYRPFVKPLNVLDFLCDALHLRKYNDLHDEYVLEEAAQHLSMLEVYPDHLPYEKKYKIKDRKDVFLKPASVESFLLDGRETTVENYFRKRYKKVLDYPNLPCLNVGRGDKVNALPMEVCWIKAGQNTKQELDLIQKRKMIEATSNPPLTRYKLINYFAKQALPEKDRLLEHFEIETGDRMVKTTARVIPPPVIKYDRAEIRGEAGKWQIQRMHLFTRIPINVWAIVHFSDRPEQVHYKSLIDEFLKQSSDKGLHMNKPINEKEIHNFSTRLHKGLDDIDKLLEWTVSNFGPDLQMILCIIDRKIRSLSRRDSWNSDSVYNRIKLVGDTKLGIVTQCIDQKNAIHPNGSTIGGLCLKINAKQGGINHCAVVEETKSLLLGTMVIGADVNHPKPGPSMHDFPSIAVGCVALDANISRYYSTCRFQKNPYDPRQRQEVILDFEAMSYELLHEFMKENGGKKPRRILFFRDGVSEGQFQAVIDLELSALKRACHKIAGTTEYNPPITLVCVQKRHHMKMFIDSRRVDNVIPGTYLDKTVTHPFEYDFYLCSHLA